MKKTMFERYSKEEIEYARAVVSFHGYDPKWFEENHGDNCYEGILSPQRFQAEIEVMESIENPDVCDKCGKKQENGIITSYNIGPGNKAQNVEKKCYSCAEEDDFRGEYDWDAFERYTKAADALSASKKKEAQ